MTPYAVLLAKPTDTDETIRKLYHAIAREAHPDSAGPDMKPSDLWFAATEAYTAIKTEDRRARWEEQQALLSGRCTECEGSGVRGTRMFKGKIKLCGACKGGGRWQKSCS